MLSSLRAVSQYARIPFTGRSLSMGTERAVT